jgi:hypothetical protein
MRARLLTGVVHRRGHRRSSERERGSLRRVERLLGVAGTCVVVSSVLCGLGVFAAGADAVESTAHVRTYELVTPNSNPKVKVDLMPTDIVGEEGNDVVFQTKGTVETGPSEELNTYESRRTENGWQPRLLSPPSVYAANYNSTYENLPNDFYVFDANLSKGIFSAEPLDPPLVEGEPAESVNIYEQETATGANSLVAPLPGTTVNEELQSKTTVLPRVAAASANLEHVLFQTGGFESEVYTWSPQEGMIPVNILPEGQGVGEGKTTWGAVAGAGVLSEVSTNPKLPYSFYYGGNRHAISENGERAFFTYPGPTEGVGGGGIYERRDQGEPDASTVEIGQGTFLDASPDGREALFSSCTRLTPNSTASEEPMQYPYAGNCRTAYDSKADSEYGGDGKSASDLYLYSEEEGSETGTLTDITTEDPTGAEVLGVLGESEDLSRVYFVADGVLASGGTAGEPNLYVWDDTEGTETVTFIATLETNKTYFNEQGDMSDWEYGASPIEHDARVSQNGEYVAFTSISPTIDPSYDNLNPEDVDEEAVPEVYLYKYGSAGPVCVSCEGKDPAKAPASIANGELNETEHTLPSYPDYEKRNLLNDGTVFFETGEKLLAADENEATDVYEYDAEAGTVALISSGTGGAAHFMGATPDGSNVFFSTDQSLLAADQNNNIDIYDARVNGGVVSALPTPKPCQDGCPATPGSAVFYGPSVPGVPQSPAPTEPFAVAKITAAQIKALARTGKITLKVTAPGPGSLGASALARLGKAKKAGSIASSSEQINAAGHTTISLELSKKSRSALAKAGKLAVEIKVTFASMTKTAHLTLKSAKKVKKPKKKKDKGKGGGKKSSAKSSGVK